MSRLPRFRRADRDPAPGRVASAAAVLPLALALVLGCEATRDADPPDATLAPPRAQATVVIEPPQLRVGSIADIEVAVVTPPEHAVRPLALPDDAALGPIWVLDAVALPIEKRGARWTHRTRVRVRARELGSGTWPASTLELIGPEDERSTLTTDPRPFEVVSVLPAFPDRVEPFPLRLPETRARLSPWIAAAGGAAVALAAVGALALVQRRRRLAERDRARGETTGLDAAAPWTAALGELSAAAAGSDTDWRGSADAIAVALRRYAAQRWGFAIECRTTEELAALTPPLAMSFRWPTALAWLRELDALRFQPDAASDAPTRIRRIAEDAGRWIQATIPAEPRP